MSDVPPIRDAHNPQSERPARILFAVLAVLGLGFLALGLAPERLLGRAVLVDLDRTTRHPAPEALVEVGSAALAAALACIALAALVFWKRRAVAGGLSRLAADARSLAADARAATLAAWRDSSPLHRLALLAVVALGALHRFGALGRAMRPDESISYIFFTSRSLADVLTDYSTTNNHVLYSILSLCSHRLLGVAPEVLRLPAVAAGMLVVPATYAIVRRLFGGGSALLAAALVAGAPEMILKSTEARGYTLAMLLFLVLLAAAARLRTRPGPAAWALFVLAGAFGFFAIPVMLFALSVVSFWLLFTAPPGRRLALLGGLTGAAVATAALAGLLYLPIFLRSGPEALVANRWIAPLGPQLLLEKSARNLLDLLGSWTAGLSPFLILPLAAGALASIPRQARDGVRGSAFWLGCIAGVLALVVLQRAAPEARYLQFLFPLAAGLVAFGLEGLLARVGVPDGVRAGALGLGGLVLAASWPWMAGPPELETFFVDVERLVEDTAAELEEGEALAGHRYEGTVEVARFYMMERGRPPTLVHKYVPPEGPEQLAGYRDVLVVLRRFDPDAPLEPSDVAAVLEVSAEELDLLFEPPQVVRRYPTLDLFRLAPRTPPEEGAPPARAELWYPQTR